MIVISVNYHTTPIEIREKLSFRQDELVRAMAVLQEQWQVVENVIISTCNRTEIYAVVRQVDDGLCALKQFLADWFALPIVQFEQHLIVYQHNEAIAHLFRVSAGVDSMVIGETQILGQVRTSFLQGQAIGTTKTIFNQLFKEAISFSKKAHATTGIGEHAVSISYAAVQLLMQEVDLLCKQKVLVLGAGEMGELTVKNLMSLGVKEITVINRTFSRGEELAHRYGVKVKSIDELEEALVTSTVVISSTASTVPIIGDQLMQTVMTRRENHALHLIDIAVPRDIEACVGDLQAVHLYDIDAIQQIVDSNLAERKKAAQQIEGQIQQEVQLFNEWLARLQVVPIIRALEAKGKQIQEETLTSMLNKIPQLTAREKKVLQNHTQSIVNQLIRAPIQEVKALALVPGNENELALLTKTLGLEDYVASDEDQAMIAKLAKERLTD